MNMQKTNKKREEPFDLSSSGSSLIIPGLRAEGPDDILRLVQVFIIFERAIKLPRKTKCPLLCLHNNNIFYLPKNKNRWSFV